MKFLIDYECRNGNGVSNEQFEIELDHEPNMMDSDLILEALKDSTKYHQEGIGGVSITSISLIL
ncbi:hypothetical protein [Salinivibrio sp. ES.052]|uniref:hypothetical protein n=1 Tax=Salinivibrio sp. ES.052 TaxID=1882823 RepID=UPI000927658A|nr:hypothetical protein [Salinivibrio sp. ES.052]SIN82858.1 hypothetical protein SAMN05444724_0752 [Salinivibrio sp. ES.052]